MSTSHGNEGHGNEGHDKGQGSAEVFENDAFPDFVARLASGEIPYIVPWSNINTWCQNGFTGEYRATFVGVTNNDPNPQNIQSEPALRAYLLYVWDLRRRVAKLDVEQPGSGKKTFDEFFYVTAKNLPGAEGFAALYESLKKEYHAKGITHKFAIIHGFFSFVIRALSAEEISHPRNTPLIGASLKDVTDRIPAMRQWITLGNNVELAEINKELEHMKVEELVPCLYFFREMFNQFKGKNAKNVQLILFLTEQHLAQKLTAQVAAGADSAHAAPHGDAKDTLPLFTNGLLVAYGEASGGGLEPAEDALKKVVPKDGLQDISSRIVRKIKGVFGGNEQKGGLGALNDILGISQAIEIALGALEIVKNYKDKKNRDKKDHGTDHPEPPPHPPSEHH